MKKKKFKRENCDNVVRAVIKFADLTISLTGKHSYEWSIVKHEGSKITIMTFDNSDMARKEFERYKAFVK